LFVSQTLSYDSLSALVNSNIAGKEFQVGKGLLKKTVRIDSVRLQGGGEKMFIKVFVSKAAKGIFFLEGKPTWNPEKQQLYFDQLDYHIESKQWLVKSASYLLDGTITSKLAAYSTFDLSERAKSLIGSIAQQMNRQLYPGVNSRGFLNKFSIDSMQAVANGLHVQGMAEGKLWIDVNAQQLLQQWL
jgi:hypothetical protein